MKMLIAAAALALAVAASPVRAETIKPGDAHKHVGQTVTVEGMVERVHVSARSNTTFLDMGGRYPDNAFAAVIFAKDAAIFPDAAALDGRTVAVTGPVTLYRGKPEIILKTADQLEPR